MKLLFSALALATALSVPMADARVPIGAAVAPSPQADMLVALLVGDDAMVRLAMRAFNSGFDKGLAADPQAAKLYTRDPGFRSYVTDRMRKSFTALLQRELPTLRSQLSTLVTSEMTPVEVADTLTFFSSPIGKKLIAQIYQAMGDKAGQDEAAMQQAAIASVMENLQPEDYPALMAFGASSAAQKMQVVNPKISATSQAWAAKLLAENQPGFRQQVVAAAAEYLAQKQ